MYTIKYQSPKGVAFLKLKARSNSDAVRELFRLHRVELHRVIEVSQKN
ncbi:hypothetical protein PEDI_04360 [Persicobacter diffluens]|uniref:Uncharacterized protein n=1 Tax=Persicobacter diffluens TaxID=981 RepID=A0AAN4VV57_9BACT|nr:hypothetical protein PEDI_04360 [Persicobacter diffluens]